MSTKLKSLADHSDLLDDYIDNVIGALEQLRSYVNGQDSQEAQEPEEKPAKKARAAKPKPEPEVVEDEDFEEDEEDDEEDDEADDEFDDETEASIDVVRVLAGRMIMDGVVKRLDVVRMVKKLGGSKMNDLDQDALQSLYNQLRKKQG
jgi:hypothetical protein